MLWLRERPKGATAVRVSIRPMRGSSKNLSRRRKRWRESVESPQHLKRLTPVCGWVLATGATFWDMIEWILKLSLSARVPLDSRWPWTSGFAVCVASCLEKKLEPQFLPKMERCNARSMEMFRRIGLADALRAAGLTADAVMDVYVILTMARAPLLHLKYPSVDSAREQIRKVNDGSAPLE